MTGPLQPSRTCRERETMSRLVALRAGDALDAAGEALLSRHLASCPACLAEAVPVDPTLLFTRLSAAAEAEELTANATFRGARARREEPSEADLLAADVLAALRIRAVEGGRRASRFEVASRPWLKAAAVVLLAAGLAAALVFTRPGGPGPEPAAAVARSVTTWPPIEELESPGVRVYEFASSKPEEPTVVFVANPDADL
jgi:hypothetical protein